MRDRLRSPNHSRAGLQEFLPVALAALLLGGCAVSPDPVIEELIKTRAPTFGGLSSKSYTTPSHTFALSGECDTASRGLQYTIDNVNWNTIASGCTSAGTFAFNVSVASLADIHVRAKTKTGYTSSAEAKIHYLIPPSSPFFSVVSMGRSENDNVGVALQASMGLSFQGKPMSNATKTLNTELTGVVYGQ